MATPHSSLHGLKKPGPTQRPAGMPHYDPNMKPVLVDPYNHDAGQDDIEQDNEIWSQRLWDRAGDDSAYDMGISPVRKPAPKGGRKLTDTDFLP